MKGVAVHRRAGTVVGMRLVTEDESNDHVKAMADWELTAVDKEPEPEEEDRELGKVEARLCRGIAARLNYIALDRIDLQFF